MKFTGLIAFEQGFQKCKFFSGGPNFGEGIAENLGKIANNRDIIVMRINGWSISKGIGCYSLVPQSL